MINWGPYLESVCREYDRWWEVYTLTDVAGKRPHEQRQNIFPFLDLGLMVQGVKSEERQGTVSYTHLTLPTTFGV